jgi:hypothetical protein
LPDIGRIQSTTFQALLTDLGITRNNIPFSLRSEVTPVVLVGGTVSFIASPTPAYRVTDIFTAGILVAPVAGTILADTGPLPIGAYSLEMILTTDTDSNSFSLEWRNAGNTANLRSIRLWNSPDGPGTLRLATRFLVENDNERFRLLVSVNANVGIEYQGTIQART